MKRCLFLAAVMLFIALPAQAVIPIEHQPPSYYSDPNVCRGWFCYELPPLEPVEPEQEKAVPEIQSFSGVVDWDAIWTMPPAQLKELINQALSYAQENPRDEARMVTYLKLQGVAMRRAKVFQEAWAETILRYPVLDSTVDRAPTLAATTAEVVAEREDRAAAISQMRADMGILYFYSPTCRYCQQQSTILENFISKWGWQNITAINVTENPEAARKYGVQSVPDIWVVGNVKDETLQRRLSSGLVEFPDLERGLLKAWSLWNNGAVYERPTMTHHIESFDGFLKRKETPEKTEK